MFEIIRWVVTALTIEFAGEHVVDELSKPQKKPEVVQIQQIAKKKKEENSSSPLKHTYKGTQKYYIIVFQDQDGEWYYTNYGLLGTDGKMRQHSNIVQCHGEKNNTPIVFVFTDPQGKNKFLSPGGFCPLSEVNSNPCACFKDYITRYVK